MRAKSFRLGLGARSGCVAQDFITKKVTGFLWRREGVAKPWLVSVSPQLFQAILHERTTKPEKS